MIDKTITDKGRPISIHFHPMDFDKKQHIIEKSEGGIKRKYMRGISSGMKEDGQGERMTAHCVQSLMNQGNSGNVLLYAGLHGVNFIDDLGILKNSDIYKGDWVTEYMLYDEIDEPMVGLNTVQRAQKLWSQVNGFSPYKHPIQKGFSIEGVVPEDCIVDKIVNDDGSWSNRVIDDMIIDGTVVVNRPAYKDSVVTAVYKCLGELHPEAKTRFQELCKGLLIDTLKKNQEKRSFYQKFFEINSVLEDKISEVMNMTDDRYMQRLDILFNEYKTTMIDLIVNNKEMFNDESPIEASGSQSSVEKDNKSELLMKQLVLKSSQLAKILLKEIGDKKTCLPKQITKIPQLEKH